MTKFQPGPTPCLNCNTPTKGRYNYKGVIVCSNCFGLAQMCDRRAVKQTLHLLEIYRESLRVALASGRLKPNSELPTGKKVSPPTRDDLRTASQKLFDWTKRVRASADEKADQQDKA